MAAPEGLLGDRSQCPFGRKQSLNTESGRSVSTNDRQLSAKSGRLLYVFITGF